MCLRCSSHHRLLDRWFHLKSFGLMKLAHRRKMKAYISPLWQSPMIHKWACVNIIIRSRSTSSHTNDWLFMCSVYFYLFFLTGGPFNYIQISRKCNNFWFILPWFFRLYLPPIKRKTFHSAHAGSEHTQTHTHL